MEAISFFRLWYCIFVNEIFRTIVKLKKLFQIIKRTFDIPSLVHTHTHTLWKYHSYNNNFLETSHIMRTENKELELYWKYFRQLHLVKKSGFHSFWISLGIVYDLLGITWCVLNLSHKNKLALKQLEMYLEKFPNTASNTSVIFCAYESY